MKLVALCGAAAAGKDTVADALPARKLAFADTLYREVAEAFGVTVEWLKDRRRKEVKVYGLAFPLCKDLDFSYEYQRKDDDNEDPFHNSPRQILQWWGDYRRAQDPDYFVESMETAFLYNIYGEVHGEYVITDVRFPNEAAMVRQLGGEIWQIRRTGVEAGATGHASDNDGSQFNPDRIIYNNGSLEELSAKALKEWNK